MTAITLTSKQKKQLLEMCQYLFPEYKKKWSINNGQLEFQDKQYSYQIMLSDYTGSYYSKILDKKYVCRDAVTNRMIKRQLYNHMHWFEFCITHLATKLYLELFKSDISIWSETLTIESFLVKVYTKELHPVDYLYAEFNKIKKKK